jgi:mannose-6-phosphate isomerase-like protein (cupin superfamily)
MPLYVSEEDLPVVLPHGQHGGMLIDGSNGATNGFCMGISYYDQEAYGEPGVHEDQEGFYVLAGTGVAKIGEEEFRVCPGTAFIAAKGVSHTMKRDPDSGPIKVLWCHGAV